MEIETLALADQMFDWQVGHWLVRAPTPALVHGFEGGTLQTFKAARRLGCTTVLDVASRHDDYLAFAAEEPRRWGFAEPHHPARISRHVHQERHEADLLLVPSNMMARMVRDEDGISGQRVVVLPYGADAESFTPAAQARSSGFRVLCAGHVNLRKGIGYLLEAWSRLRLLDAELLLVGDADNHGRSVLTRYQGLFRWLRSVPHSEMPQLFAASDLFVCPSLIEGSPLVVYEAMAAGLPVVTSQNAKAVVRDGIDGIVVPIRDAAALNEAIAFMYRHPEARRRMGAAGRRRIEEAFTWKHYRDRLATIYKQLLATGEVTSAPVGEAI